MAVCVLTLSNAHELTLQSPIEETVLCIVCLGVHVLTLLKTHQPNPQSPFEEPVLSCVLYA